MLDSLDTLIAFVLIMLVVSMLITICVQLLSALFNLRGRNLGRGLTHTFDTILPDLGPKAKILACRILSGRLLSDSQMPSGNGAGKDRAPSFKRCATAVRPDEVFDALHRIATGRSDKFKDLQSDAIALLKGLGVSQLALEAATAQVATALGKTAENAHAISAATQETLTALPEAQRKPLEQAINAMAQKLAGFEADAAQRIQQGAVRVEETFQQASEKFQYWFEVSQERAQQWFTTHTRWFTVALAILFAFALQLDTVEIFKFVSSNKAARDKLVAQVGAVTNQAERIVGDGSTVLGDALTNWRNGLQDQPAKQAVASVNVTASDTRGSLRGRIAEALGANVSKDKLLKDFDLAVDEVAQKKLDQGAQDYSTLKHSLDDTGFNLFVSDWNRWHHGWAADFWPHFLGMLFSVGLLSLGAPFWFNALKSLANLRSRVAENISSEQKREKSAPAQTATSAPPTVMPSS
jgi:hypothetical protein